MVIFSKENTTENYLLDKLWTTFMEVLRSNRRDTSFTGVDSAIEFGAHEPICTKNAAVKIKAMNTEHFGRNDGALDMVGIEISKFANDLLESTLNSDEAKADAGTTTFHFEEFPIDVTGGRMLEFEGKFQLAFSVWRLTRYPNMPQTFRNLALCLQPGGYVALCFVVRTDPVLERAMLDFEDAHPAFKPSIVSESLEASISATRTSGGGSAGSALQSVCIHNLCPGFPKYHKWGKNGAIQGCRELAEKAGLFVHRMEQCREKLEMTEEYVRYVWTVIAPAIEIPDELNTDFVQNIVDSLKKGTETPELNVEVMYLIAQKKTAKK